MSKMTCIVYAEPVVKVNRRGNIEEKGNLDLSFQILHSFSVPTAMIMKSAVKKGEICRKSYFMNAYESPQC